MNNTQTYIINFLNHILKNTNPDDTGVRLDYGKKSHCIYELLSYESVYSIPTLSSYKLIDLISLHFLFNTLKDLYSSFSNPLQANVMVHYFLYSRFNLSTYLKISPKKGEIRFKNNDMQVKSWIYKNDIHFTKVINDPIRQYIKSFLSDEGISSRYEIVTPKHNLPQKQISYVPGKNLIPMLIHFMYYDGRTFNKDNDDDYIDIDLRLPSRKKDRDKYSLNSYKQINKTCSSLSMNIYEYLHLNSLFYMNKIRLFNSYIQFYTSNEFIFSLSKDLNYDYNKSEGIPTIINFLLVKDDSFIKQIFQSSFPDPMYIFNIFFYEIINRLQLEIKFIKREECNKCLVYAIENSKKNTLNFLQTFDTIYSDSEFLSVLLKDIDISTSYNKEEDYFSIDEEKLIKVLSKNLEENNFVKYLIANKDNDDDTLFKYIDYETIKALITGEKL